MGHGTTPQRPLQTFLYVSLTTLPSPCLPLPIAFFCSIWELGEGFGVVLSSSENEFGDPNYAMNRLEDIEKLLWTRKCAHTNEKMCQEWKREKKGHQHKERQKMERGLMMTCPVGLGILGFFLQTLCVPLMKTSLHFLF